MVSVYLMYICVCDDCYRGVIVIHILFCDCAVFLVLTYEFMCFIEVVGGLVVYCFAYSLVIIVVLVGNIVIYFGESVSAIVSVGVGTIVYYVTCCIVGVVDVFGNRCGVFIQGVIILYAL